jgi:hypothetical protein
VLGFLPVVAFEKPRRFAFRVQPCFDLFTVEQGRAVTLGYPVSEIELGQHKHHRDMSLLNDSFEQAQCPPRVFNQK